MNDVSLEISRPISAASAEAPRWDYYSKCIHCGLCLNACPTYRVLGAEMDSPRGRIYQMIQVADGKLALGENYVRHMDLCLDCRACETACPSGVEYGRLVESARSQIASRYRRPRIEAWLRNAFLGKILPDRKRLETAGKALRFYQRSGVESLVLNARLLRLFSRRLDRVARLAPRMERPFFTAWLGTVVPAVGVRKHRVAFHAGCIANLAFARLNDATVRVLARNGCEVIIPREQACCGALHIHAGERDMARKLAKQNIRAFEESGCDAIITNAAGCGSALKEYSQLFESVETEYYEAAKRFSGAVRDATEFLAGIELENPTRGIAARATYQDPCHLAHAQGIRSAPRKLLRRIPGLELVELEEADLCCGSAGIYNISQNDMSDRLLEAKMRRLDETGASLIVTANPGCMLQLRAGVARSRQKDRRVAHVIELLDEAYREPAPSVDRA